MATSIISLTQSYQEVSSSGILITMATTSGGSVILTSSDSTPEDNASGHVVYLGATNVFPAPISGSWYVRIVSGSGTLTYTEV